MKERVQQLATGENSSHSALRQIVPPQGTAIDNLVNKEDIEDYFDNLAVDQTILYDNKAVIVRKKEITWKALVNDYKLFTKAKLEACVLILHAVDETWVLDIKDEENLFTQVNPRQLLDHL